MNNITEMIAGQHFPFQRGEKCLRGSIVETRSDPAHRLPNPELPAQLGERVCGIGAAAVGKSWRYFLIFKYLCDDSEYITDTLEIDEVQPNISEIDTVSYDPVSGFWQVGWKQNPAIDLKGYIVWESNGGNNSTLDTIVNPFFIDSSSNPNGSARSYRITVLDSCMQQSDISDSHRPIFAQINGGSCNLNNSLVWSPYDGSGKSVDFYRIYSKMNIDPDFAIDTNVDASVNSVSFDLHSSESKAFYIRAFFQDGTTARSNPVQITASDSFSVDTNYIANTTWNPNFDALVITGIHHTSQDWDSVYLYKTHNGKRNPIHALEIDVNNPSFLYSDPGVIDTFSYRYQMELVDRCRRRYTSNESGNMVLMGVETDDDEYQLNWNNYTSWLNNIDRYEIHAGDPSISSTWNLHQIVATDTAQRIVFTQPSMDRRCFSIYAFENGPNSFGYSATSQSNPVCFIQKPEVWFPNAFAPYGINNTFLPVGISIDRKKSNIQIYSQTGQKIWDHDLTQSWTGFAEDGKPYFTNVFAYYAVIYFLNGDKKSYSGNITVLY